MTADHDNLLPSGAEPQRRREIRNVLAMSIPVVVTTSSRAMMDVADYIMITRLHLPEAQAAILPAQVIMWSYIVIGLGIASMVNTFASQCLGRGDYKECGAYAWQGLYLALFVGGVGALLFPFLPALVERIGHEPAVQAQELAYGRIALLTTAPTIAAAAFGWFFIGIHKPWTTMWSALEANVVNIVVSYVLMFGYLGFEPMGIAGAAWGTMAAVCYRTLRLMATLVSPSVDRKFSCRTTWQPSWRRLKNLLRVGAPCGAQWFCDVVVWAIFVNVLVGRRFGTVHLIATNTAWQYMRIAFLPTMGVGQALTALVGKSIGAGDPERAKREAAWAVKITVAYMSLLSVIYVLFGGTLISWFNPSPDVIAIGATIMVCTAVFQIFDALAIVYTSALRGAGDTFVPSMFFMVCNWVIIVGGGWAMVELFPELESLGPWIAASTLIIVAGIFLWWRWRSEVWMRIELLGDRTSGPRTEETAGKPVVVATSNESS